MWGLLLSQAVVCLNFLMSPRCVWHQLYLLLHRQELNKLTAHAGSVLSSHSDPITPKVNLQIEQSNNSHSPVRGDESFSAAHSCCPGAQLTPRCLPCHLRLSCVVRPSRVMTPGAELHSPGLSVPEHCGEGEGRCWQHHSSQEARTGIDSALALLTPR